MQEILNHVFTTGGVGLRFAIIASRYNDFITEKLVQGAIDAFLENGVAPSDIEVFWCPGGLEIPALAKRVARYGAGGKAFHGMVCCGCVIRGETDHYHFVAEQAMRGVADVALEAEIAVGNAILTVATVEQALERAGEKSTNKGYEAALAALAMANQFRKLPKQQ